MLLMFSLACSLIDGSTGCDFREGSVNGPDPRCQERNGTQSPGFDIVCEGLGGVAIEGGCPMDGVVGGCQLDGTGEVIDWYYAPETEETVMVTCESDGEFVAP